MFFFLNTRCFTSQQTIYKCCHSLILAGETVSSKSVSFQELIFVLVVKNKQWQEHYTIIQQRLRIHSDALPVRLNVFSLSPCHFELFGPGFAQDFRFTSSYTKHTKNFQWQFCFFCTFQTKKKTIIINQDSTSRTVTVCFSSAIVLWC